MTVRMYFVRALEWLDLAMEGERGGSSDDGDRPIDPSSRFPFSRFPFSRFPFWGIEEGSKGDCAEVISNFSSVVVLIRENK